MLRNFGGTILAEQDVHESFNGDGLIAGYFGREPLQRKEPPISRNRYSTILFRFTILPQNSDPSRRRVWPVIPFSAVVANYRIPSLVWLLMAMGAGTCLLGSTCAGAPLKPT
jgi:hypothetical protein